MNKATDTQVKPALKNYVYLIEQFAITDFKMRFSKSVLGYFWSLIHPLLFFLAYYLVFSVVLKLDSGKTYAFQLLSGILIWNFFCEATLNGMRSLDYKSSLLTKTKFPRIIIPLGSLLANQLTFLINLLVFLVFVQILGNTLHISMLFTVLIFIEVSLLAFGVSLVLSSFYLKFRDIQYIWSILLQLGFWFVPIIYKLDMIPAKYVKYVLMNPLAQVIVHFQNLVINCKSPEFGSTVFIISVSLIVFLAGLAIFLKNQIKFSEWV